MDAPALERQLRALLRLEDLLVADALATGFQVLVVALITIWAGKWLRVWIWRSARKGQVWAEIASLVSQGAAFLVYGVGATIALSLLGLNPTAIAAIIGAATFGSSLALQDVAKSFVNGAYLLIERPFRIGDRVRIGSDEGRVEDISIRLTRLRTDSGNRVLVPSTVVLTSPIANATIGNEDRRQYALRGIDRPLVEIEPEIIRTLKGTPHLSARGPVVEILEASPEGASIRVTISHDLGHRVDAQVVSRLRSAFPEATVSPGTAGEGA